MHQLRN